MRRSIKVDDLIDFERKQRKVSSFDLYSVFACREGWCIVDGLFNCWGHLIVVGYSLLFLLKEGYLDVVCQYGTIDAHASYPLIMGVNRMGNVIVTYLRLFGCSSSNFNIPISQGDIDI